LQATYISHKQTDTVVAADVAVGVVVVAVVAVTAVVV